MGLPEILDRLAGLTKVVDKTYSPIAYQIGHVHSGHGGGRIVERRRIPWWKRNQGRCWEWIAEVPWVEQGS